MADESSEGGGGQGEPGVDELLRAMREVEVGSYLLSISSTLASLAYAKIEQGALDQARMAIDGIGALLPVFEGAVDEQLHRDFERALANLRLAYAGVAANAEAKAEPEPPADEPADEPPAEQEPQD